MSDSKSNANNEQLKVITVRNSFKVKTIIILTTIVLCSFFDYLSTRINIFGVDNQKLDIGTFWTEPTLIAEHNFSIYKPIMQYRAELQNAKDSVTPVFLLDIYAEINLRERIMEIVEHLNMKSDAPLKDYTSAEKIRDFFKQPEIVQAREIAKIKNQLMSYVRRVYQAGYMNVPIDKFKLSDVFTVRLYPNLEYIIEKNMLYDKHKYSIQLQNFCIDLFNRETNSMIYETIFKISQPNLNFSEELTLRAEKLVEQSVRKTMGIVRKGETIIKSGERITSDNIEKIKAYKNAIISYDDNYFSFWHIIGSIGNSTMLYSLLLLFLIIIRKRIWADNYHVMLLSATLVLVSAMGCLSFQIQLVNPNLPIEYLIILPAFSMFVAIVFDSRTAFYTTVTMSLMLVGVRRSDYYVGLTMLFTGTIAAYAVRDVQDRAQMFSSIIFIFIGFILSILVINCERGFDFSLVMPQLFISFLNAITAPVITFVLLFCINKYSKFIVTNLKLREYIDNEHPILTTMRETSPGSFGHSREVSKLAELAANAIGANALLVKVAGLFHDIGKMNNPIFFTENQNHETKKIYSKLNPIESAKIIKQHVPDGIKMANEMGLPQQIIDFIPQHHGTTLVKHFYNVALNEAAETGTVVNPNDFRYPGPKPQTKEATILMLCDSAEAISKSTIDMEQFIAIFDANIDERIKEGQFDETNITIGEIKKVKEVLYSEIKGKLHTRTQYASTEENNNEVANEVQEESKDSDKGKDKDKNKNKRKR